MSLHVEAMQGGLVGQKRDCDCVCGSVCLFIYLSVCLSLMMHVFVKLSKIPNL
jgi:hypothetical protein